MTALDKIKASGIAGGFAGAMGGLLRKLLPDPISLADEILTVPQGDRRMSFPDLLCGPYLVQAAKRSEVPCPGATSGPDILLQDGVQSRHLRTDNTRRC